MPNSVSPLTRIRIFRSPSSWVLAGVALLVIGSPLGGGASQPAVFAGYRTVLFLVTGLCLWVIHKETVGDLPVGLYVAGAAGLTLMLVSVWASPGSNPSGQNLWYEHLLFAVFFVALIRFGALQSARWKQGTLGVVVGGALLQFALTFAPLDNVFENENHLAAYLLPGLAGSVATVLFAHDWRWRACGAVASITLFVGVTGTLSRGATIAAVGIAATGVLKIRRRALVVGAAGAALAVAATVIALNPGLIRQFTDRGEIDPYNYQRIEIWRSTASMIAEYPVLGVGLTRYDDVARRFRPPVDTSIARYMKRQAIAHSEYLQYLSETGVPAGLLLVFLILAYILLVWRTDPADSESTLTHRAALLATVGLAVHGVVDNVFEVPVVLAGLVVAALASDALIRRAPRRRSPMSPGARWAAGAVALALFASSTALPAAAYGFNRLGQRYLQVGDIESAERAQRFALAIQVDDAVLLTNMGLVYEKRFDKTGSVDALDTAEGYFIRAIQANPDFLGPRTAYVDTLLARFTGVPGADAALHRKLVEANEGILRLDPFLPGVGKNLAEAYYQSGRPRDAYLQLQRTIELEPNFVPAYLRLAEWYGEDGRVAESQTLRNTALSIVDRYRDRQTLTDYESLLLGRP